jgi:hypothetical protein
MRANDTFNRFDESLDDLMSLDEEDDDLLGKRHEKKEKKKNPHFLLADLLVVFPVSGGVTQMHVKVPRDETVAEVTAVVASRCPAGTPRDMMGLCVNPTRVYPEEFRSSPSFPFLDENAQIESLREILRLSASVYWKPVAGIIRDREHAMDQSKGLPSIQIKIVFPPTFPAVSKTFRIDYERTGFEVFRFS